MAGSSPGRRSAFSLIELLVVIAIIAILIALLFSGVQRVRESGSRTQCINHLSQIGKATLQYIDQKGSIPTAGSPDSGNPSQDIRDFGWTYELLPYLDQNDLYNTGQTEAPNFPTMRAYNMKLYQCPTRGIGRALRSGRYSSDYAGNSGSFPSNSGSNPDGVILRSRGSKNTYTKSPYKIHQMTDGPGYTIFFAEKLVNLPTMGGNGGSTDYSDNESWAGPGTGSGDSDLTRGAMSYTLADGTTTSWRTPLRDTRLAAPPNTYLDYRFGSSHPLSMNAVMGDGAVRPVAYGVDPVVFHRACSRNDGQPFSHDQLQQ